jgi:hypothetical protein
MRTTAAQAAKDPAFLIQWLHERGGRVFSELHLRQDLVYSMQDLMTVKESSVWQESGCQMFFFTMLR